MLVFLALFTGTAHAAMLRGVNLSGAELNPAALPGRPGTDYIYPDASALRYFASAGMNVVRLPVLWERLQPVLGAKLDAAELARVDSVIAAAAALHMRVIVDLHDYGGWRGQHVGSTAVPRGALADFWKRMTLHYRGMRGGDTVIFGLMNEPHDMDAAAWAAAEQAAIDGIRLADGSNLILVSGVGWDGAHNFVSGAGYGLPNAQALQLLHDPLNNYAVEMHQYLDNDYSGTHAECIAPAAARATLAPATSWLRATHHHGFLGEFAGGRSAACRAALDALLNEVDQNRDVWIGWSYWAAGPWWGNYMFSVQPEGGRDAPQMSVLREHLGTGS